MFTVIIVGRPNVGKSTLFNRLSTSHKAIVHDFAGVTRDVQETSGRISDLEFKLLDTAGLDFLSKKDQLLTKSILHTKTALDQSDVILFVVDGKVGVTSEDKSYADWLRKTGLPVILIINKSDHSATDHNLNEFYKLGINNMVLISAEHNIGMPDLYEKLIEFDTQETQEDPEHKPIKIAIIGRPNAGKSTFINNLIDEERLLTGPEPGITRDSIAVSWNYKNYNIQLVDTAGIRKRNNIQEFLEKQSVQQSLRSIDFAHVVVLMVDASIPLEKQDLSIAELAYKEGKPIALVVNKTDLMQDKQAEVTELNLRARELLYHIGKTRICYISALYKKDLDHVLDSCIDLYEKWQIKLPTNKLNDWLQQAVEAHPLPLLEGGRRVRIKFINQIKSRPPTFQLFTNKPEKISGSYLKYLSNSLCERFNLDGVPLRFKTKKIDNPYDTRK